MKKLYTSLFAFIFALSLGLTAYAKEAQDRDMNKKEGATKGGEMKSEQSAYKHVTKAGANTFRANDIIGAEVTNPQGKGLGKITELGIDPKTDRVKFAVIAHGGAVGVGEKDVAVPLNSLSMKKDENGKIKMFVLNTSEDRFSNSPTFDKESWPDKRKVEKSDDHSKTSKDKSHERDKSQ